MEDFARTKSQFAGLTFIIAGPPSCGKGTQSMMLAKKFGLVHLSTGDIFREQLEQNTELGKLVKDYMQRGCFVPDEIVINFIKHRLSQQDVHQRGCIIDGFPRTADQAEVLVRLVNVDKFILLEVPDSVLIKRAPGRRVDPQTGAIYHMKFIPPPVAIQSRLKRREYDSDISIRLSVHHEQMHRILPYFNQKVIRVNGMQDPRKVFEAVAAVVTQPLANRSGGGDGGESGESKSNQLSLCSVCLDSPADFLVIPCGHQCACEDCLKKIQASSGDCPICRVNITSIQRVFKCGDDGMVESVSASGNNGSRLQYDPTAGLAVHQDIDDVLDKGTKSNNANEWPDEEDDWSDEAELSDGREAKSSRADEPRVSIGLSQNCKNGGDSMVAVHIDVPVLPAGTRREPVDICCIVDISGSMNALAKYEADNGSVKDDGLTILDIVKHGVKTVMHTLEDQDRLAIVAFNGKASTSLTLTCMTKNGQQRAAAALDDLRPSGKTNIWDGLLHGMECLRQADGTADAGSKTGGCNGSSGRRKAVLLLTDGQPNICPPRGHVSELRNYKDRYTGFDFQMNTFGFGYSLDSKLLLDLAVEGHGTYAFIPDAIILGTTFVNSVANFLSMHSQNATLSIMPRNGAMFTGPVLGDPVVAEESWGRAISLGPLQYGQSRDCVVPMSIPHARAGKQVYVDVVLSYPHQQCGGEQLRVQGSGSSRYQSHQAVLASLLAKTVTVGNLAVTLAEGGRGKKAQQHVQELAQQLAAAAAAATTVTGDSEDTKLIALKADVSGRMLKALQGKPRFNRWGKHYLRALVRSHQLEQCTNFMDTGLQHYGGALFKSLRAKGDQVFLGLPAPKPSAQQQTAPRGRISNLTRAPTRSAAPKPDMRTYYAGAGGGCFGETAKVVVVSPNGSHVPTLVCDVQPGHEVLVADGTAQVRCVAQIARSPLKKLLGLPCGLTITPGHPVRVQGKWQRPRDLPEFKQADSPSHVVYNFVLDRCHILLVNGIQCVTWGHAMKEDVVKHDYYGTNLIVSDLSRLPGWKQGYVKVH